MCEHTAQPRKKGKKNQPTSILAFGFLIRAAAASAEKREERGGMAEHKEEPVLESVMDKISDKFHGGDSSSSSDSDDEKKKGSSSAAPSAEAVKAKIYRLFGRERPVHSVLGGGKRKSRDS